MYSRDVIWTESSFSFRRVNGLGHILRKMIENKPVDVREESLVYTAPPMNMGCKSREENDDLAHAFPLSGLVSVRNKVM